MNEYPKDVASSDIQHQTDEELESVEEEEDSGFGNAGRIMQVWPHEKLSILVKLKKKIRFSELQGSWEFSSWLGGL